MSTAYTEIGFAFDAHKFAQKRLAFAADPRQKAVLQSSAHRMLLNCTRQWGKSTVCGIKALHRALTKPEALVIVAGPAERQSGEFLRKIEMHLHALGIEPRGDGYNDSSLRLPNGSRILGLPGKMHKTIRGFSALSLLIVDEAAQVSDELYAALRPMLATSSGYLWLLSTPTPNKASSTAHGRKAAIDGPASASPPPNARASRPNFSTKSAKCWGNATSIRNICASSTRPMTRYSKKTPYAAPSPVTPGLSSPTESENVEPVLHRGRSRPASRSHGHRHH
jgi:hypothetical protein